MYLPKAFQEQDLNTLHDAIERYNFGILISQVDNIPFATHLPFLLERQSGQKGTLVGHTAAANRQCLNAGDQNVLAIFPGPHAYISPTWYEAENVVPTWNYVAIHVLGKIQIVDQKPSLLEIVTKLTTKHEQQMPEPWSFNGSSKLIDQLLTQIVGFRIEIESIEGKWKLNQNHPPERQKKVIEALLGQTDENSIAVAKLMSDRVQ
jgi:transcriptional regulator